MTRVTYGLYRKGVREPTVTLTSTAGGFVPPTPFPSASAAVVRYHREGGAAAAERLERSFKNSSYWGPGGAPQNRGWADAIRGCFGVYRHLADQDQRPSFTEGLRSDLLLPPDELGTYIDVLLFDGSGYVPRLVLWDTNDPTNDRVLMYAAPAWKVAENELGAGRIPEVEVWHLRSSRQFTIPAVDADAALPEVERVVHRLAS